MGWADSAGLEALGGLGGLGGLGLAIVAVALLVREAIPRRNVRLALAALFLFLTSAFVGPVFDDGPFRRRAELHQGQSSTLGKGF